MKNVWVITRKELNSYFVSPIAYILFIIYAGLFGWFFWNSVGLFIYYSMESQMRGEMFPMNINDQMPPMTMTITLLHTTITSSSDCSER